MEKEEVMNIKTTSLNCPCTNCIYGLFCKGGVWNWNCKKYPNGKPEKVLYDNEDCPEFDEG